MVRTEVVKEAMLSLVRASLWGTHCNLEGKTCSHELFHNVMQLAMEQAVVGLISQGMMNARVKMESPEDAMDLYGFVRTIRHRNEEVNGAVLKLCTLLQKEGIRIMVVKGQMMAALYPDPGLRQSGDIDFLCHPDDWDKAMSLIRRELNPKVDDSGIGKDLAFDAGNFHYEMHQRLTDLEYARYRRYWEDVVMPESWEHPYSININGQDIPTLAPTYTALYVFVHIIGHMLYEGIGLRQFCDWAVLLAQQVKDPSSAPPMGANEVKSKECQDVLDVEILKRHLKGIGLEKAYSGIGAVLTDFLGLPEEKFPFPITASDHRRAPKVLKNIIDRGNFGYHLKYLQESGPIHALQLLWIDGRQAWLLGHYAPRESLWRILNLFQGWGIKLWRACKH